MNKQEILKLYKKEEDKLLVAKMLDQLEACKRKNKVTYTNFVDERQRGLLQKVLNRIQEQDYINDGGSKEAQRTIFLFYPHQLTREIIEKNYLKTIQIIEINLPNKQKGTYTHRDYLGGIMKLGLKREMIGDIVVREEGAQLIVMNEVIPFLENHLHDLIRFQKADVSVKSIKQIDTYQIQKEEKQIMVSSMRVDNVVAELVKTSRAKAEELIKQERVIVNFECVVKNSKLIHIGDKITIRGKGKFEIIEQIGNTKKNKNILKIEKYI